MSFCLSAGDTGNLRGDLGTFNPKSRQANHLQNGYFIRSGKSLLRGVVPKSDLLGWLSTVLYTCNYLGSS